MNVIFCLKTIHDFINFLQVSKNCEEAFQMMHTNPNFSAKTQEKELKIFKDCQSLQTVFGHFGNIKDFNCNLNVIYYGQGLAKPGYPPTSLKDELILCSERITKMRLVIGGDNFSIQWTTFHQMKELIIDFYSENWGCFNYSYGLPKFFDEKLHFEELNDLPKLSRICIKSISFSVTPPHLECLLQHPSLLKVANSKRKIYLYGNSIFKSSTNEYIIVVTNLLTEDPKTIVTFDSLKRIDFSHIPMFIRDWKRYYPSRILLFNLSENVDISMVDSLQEVEIGSPRLQVNVKLPPNIKSLKIIGNRTSIDIGLCHKLFLEVDSPDITISPSRNEIYALRVDCHSLFSKDLNVLKKFNSVGLLTLDEYRDTIIIPDMLGVDVIKNYSSTFHSSHIQTKVETKDVKRGCFIQ